jgi:Uma2 family endonuclease
MSAFLQAKIDYTPEEYLALEATATERSEYHQGEINPMVGASINHNRIVFNLNLLLGNALAQQIQYEVFINDLKVWLPETYSFTYPDVLVVKHPLMMYENRDDVITNPCLIIEVLSQSTANYDKGDKFDSYRTLPSLQEYILVDQYAPHVTQFIQQTAQTWLMRDYKAETDQVELKTLPVTLAMSAIYQRVIWNNGQNTD